MEIYRVEDINGLGPYSCEEELDFISWHNSCSDHPAPNEDPKLKDFWNNECKDQHKYQFAFESMEQLLKWFKSSDLAALQREGFFVSVIPVTKKMKVVKGTFQVIYKK